MIGLSKRNWRSGIDFLATLAILAASATVIWVLVSRETGQKNDQARSPLGSVPPEAISIADAATLGNDAARVVLIVYSDFQCPYCATFANQILPGLTQRYVLTGLVRVAFRHFPIAKIHPFALGAAQAAECGRRQGKFWQLHDTLFANQATLDPVSLRAHARSIGLDMSTFEGCIESIDPAQVVRADLEEAMRLGLRGTPVVFVGRVEHDGRVMVSEMLRGSRPSVEFEAALQRVLGKVD